MSHATQACATCRKQKRKCDKLLPACSRCASLQRLCDYAVESVGASGSVGSVPTAEDFAALQMKLVEIEARLNSSGGGSAPHSDQQQGFSTSARDSSVLAWSSGRSPETGMRGPSTWSEIYGSDAPPAAHVVSNKFPKSLFLDVDNYKYLAKIPPKPAADIPMDVLEILSTTDTLEQASATYFNTIHRWFPFISRKRMNLGLSLADGGPDLALLFLSMNLIITVPGPELASAADSHLYRAAKRFLFLLESAGTATILYLQALILVTLYEYSHAIYPAAWLSVGNCVRFANMLGLPSYSEATSILGPCSTWTEAEERRRVYWATHILDRVISLGSKRPFAGGPSPPSSASFLPVDDYAWDTGDMALALQRPISTPLAEPRTSPFARLLQVTLYISKAMAHCRKRLSGGRASTEENAAIPDVEMRDDGNELGEASSPSPSLNIREVTAIMENGSALCIAVRRDLETATGGSVGGDVWFALLPALCLTLSTSIMVLDLYACPESMRPGWSGSDGERDGAELAMQVEAVNGLKKAAGRVAEAAEQISSTLEGKKSQKGGVSDGYGNWTSVSANGQLIIDAAGDDRERDNGGALDQISPLCLDALYCGMSTFHWLWRENGDAEMKQGLDSTRGCLEKVGKRWRLAHEYLEIERHHDAEEMFGLR